MKRHFSLFLLLLLCLQTRLVFSQDKESFLEELPVMDEAASEDAGSIVLRGLMGTFETLLPNGILVFYNTVIKQEPWANPSADSIRDNFSGPWKWEDTDGFKVNQIGHPIQGSLSFNAGRVNGFNFYQSAFFSFLGSFTWEAFGESNGASINDVITTVSGSMIIGEMVFRLYQEVCAAGVPALIAALFNPMAGFHQLVTGWKPDKSGGNVYQFQAFLGSSYAMSDSLILSENQEQFSFRGFIGDLGFSVIYGNPFEQESRTPYEHFEFAMSLGIDAGKYMGIRLISDGYLFSFSPVFSDTDTMSTGLSLHFDFVSQGEYSLYDGTVDQYSNALDWTVKYQRLFSQNAAFQEKFHAGFTLMGVSDYYSPGASKNILKNYGYGFNVKNFSSIEHKKLGKFEVDLYYYVLWSYPGTSALTQAVVNWFFIDVTYSRFISKHFSVGITDSFASEWGFFNKSGFPDARNSNNVIKLFFAWNTVR